MNRLLSLFGLTGAPSSPQPATGPTHRPVTRAKVARGQYGLPPSFTDLLPWSG